MEDFCGEVGMAALDVGSNGSVEEGLGRSRGGSSGAMEEEAVELVLPIGGDERDKKGFGRGVLVVGKEIGENGEKDGRRGEGTRRGVRVGPVEEGDEGGRGNR